MTNRQRYNKSNPCPICNTGTKGCSSHEGLHFCRGEQVNLSYSSRGTSSCGNWNLYVKGDGNNYSKRSAPKGTYKPPKPEERLQAFRDRYSHLTTAGERDNYYNHYFSALTLNPQDRKELRQRGLRDEEITEYGFKSIQRGTFFRDMPALPGFDRGRYIGRPGIICPIRDVHGRFIGYQIKTTDGREGKYVWTVTRGEGNEVSAHLRSGELPINVARGDRGIFLTEGILKSTVASRLHNATVIGGSGGTFGNKGYDSFEQLTATLKELNPNKKSAVTLAPDAGSLANSNVVRQNNVILDKLIQLGYDVRVADWGQWYEKEAGDLDEISNLSNIKYQSVDFYRQAQGDRSLYESSIDLCEHVVGFGSGIIKRVRRVAYKAATGANKFRRKLVYVSHSTNYLDYMPGRLPEKTDKVIRFTGSATNVYSELFRKGYKYILDRSATGSGKSWAASNLTPNSCFLHEDAGSIDKQKFFYATTQSRNPTIAKFETDFTTLPARHLGYDYDRDRRTAAGNPYLVRSEKEFPDVPSNCHLTEKFLAARSNNTDVDICGKCKFASRCKTSEGDGYGFKYQMHSALKQAKIIANPQGISTSMVNPKTVGVVDEYTQSVKWLNTIDIDIVKLRQVTDVAYYVDPQMRPELDKLTPLLSALRSLLCSKPENRYGIGTTDIVKQLPEVDYDYLKPAIAIIYTEIEKYNQQVIDDNKDVEGLLQSNWLEPLLLFLSGKNPHGSLHYNHLTLSLTTRNERVISTFDKMHGVVFQDATGSKLDLAFRLGISVDEIVEVTQAEMPKTNLTIRQITGFGRLGKDRRESATLRVNAARETISALHDNVGFIDFKKNAQPGDLHHFSDGRGSNRFEKCDAVASIGIPCSNLSSLKAAYETYTGTKVENGDRNLQLYIDQCVISEIIQEAGRLRANRRLEENLTYYLLGDLDTTFLEEMGYTVIRTEAIAFDLRCADRQEKTRYSVLKAFKDLTKEGAKVTQKALAAVAGCTQSNISQLAKSLGGWKCLLRVFDALLGKVEGGITKLSEADRCVAVTYLPGIFEADFGTLVGELAFIKEAYTEKDEAEFYNLLQHVPADAVAAFLRRLIQGFTKRQRYELQIILQ